MKQLIYLNPASSNEIASSAILHQTGRRVWEWDDGRDIVFRSSARVQTILESRRTHETNGLLGNWLANLPRMRNPINSSLPIKTAPCLLVSCDCLTLVLHWIRRIAAWQTLSFSWSAHATKIWSCGVCRLLWQQKKNQRQWQKPVKSVRLQFS